MLEILLLGAVLGGPAHAAEPDPAPTESAPAEPAPPALDRRHYERNMRTARTGLVLGLGGAAATGAGIAMIFASNTETVFFTGIATTVVGGGALLVGGGMASVASVTAASHLRDAGVRVSTAPGWIGAGVMVGSLALTGSLGAVVTAPAFAVGLVACGVQVRANGRAEATELTVRPWIDPRTRQLGLAGSF